MSSTTETGLDIQDLILQRDEADAYFQELFANISWATELSAALNESKPTRLDHFLHRPTSPSYRYSVCLRLPNFTSVQIIDNAAGCVTTWDINPDCCARRTAEKFIEDRESAFVQANLNMEAISSQFFLNILKYLHDPSFGLVTTSIGTSQPEWGVRFSSVQPAIIFTDLKPAVDQVLSTPPEYHMDLTVLLDPNHQPHITLQEHRSTFYRLWHGISAALPTAVDSFYVTDTVSESPAARDRITISQSAPEDWMIVDTFLKKRLFLNSVHAEDSEFQITTWFTEEVLRYNASEPNPSLQSTGDLLLGVALKALGRARATLDQLDETIERVGMPMTMLVKTGDDF